MQMLASAPDQPGSLPKQRVYVPPLTSAEMATVHGVVHARAPETSSSSSSSSAAAVDTGAGGNDSSAAAGGACGSTVGGGEMVVTRPPNGDNQRQNGGQRDSDSDESDVEMSERGRGAGGDNDGDNGEASEAEGASEDIGSGAGQQPRGEGRAKRGAALAAKKTISDAIAPTHRWTPFNMTPAQSQLHSRPSSTTSHTGSAAARRNGRSSTFPADAATIASQRGGLGLGLGLGCDDRSFDLFARPASRAAAAAAPTSAVASAVQPAGGSNSSSSSASSSSSGISNPVAMVHAAGRGRRTTVFTYGRGLAYRGANRYGKCAGAEGKEEVSEALQIATAAAEISGNKEMAKLAESLQREFGGGIKMAASAAAAAPAASSRSAPAAAGGGIVNPPPSGTALGTGASTAAVDALANAASSLISAPAVRTTAPSTFIAQIRAAAADGDILAAPFVAQPPPPIYAFYSSMFTSPTPLLHAQQLSLPTVISSGGSVDGEPSRKRGRPLGSKNKPKPDEPEEDEKDDAFEGGKEKLGKATAAAGKGGKGVYASEAIVAAKQAKALKGAKASDVSDSGKGGKGKAKGKPVSDAAAPGGRAGKASPAVVSAAKAKRLAAAAAAAGKHGEDDSIDGDDDGGRSKKRRKGGWSNRTYDNADTEAALGRKSKPKGAAKGSVDDDAPAARHTTRRGVAADEGADDRGSERDEGDQQASQKRGRGRPKKQRQGTTAEQDIDIGGDDEFDQLEALLSAAAETVVGNNDDEDDDEFDEEEEEVDVKSGAPRSGSKREDGIGADESEDRAPANENDDNNARSSTAEDADVTTDSAMISGAQLLASVAEPASLDLTTSGSTIDNGGDDDCGDRPPPSPRSSSPSSSASSSVAGAVVAMTYAPAVSATRNTALRRGTTGSTAASHDVIGPSASALVHRRFSGVRGSQADSVSPSEYDVDVVVAPAIGPTRTAGGDGGSLGYAVHAMTSSALVSPSMTTPQVLHAASTLKRAGDVSDALIDTGSSAGVATVASRPTGLSYTAASRLASVRGGGGGHSSVATAATGGVSPFSPGSPGPAPHLLGRRVAVRSGMGAMMSGIAAAASAGAVVTSPTLSPAHMALAEVTSSPAALSNSSPPQPRSLLSNLLGAGQSTHTRERGISVISDVSAGPPAAAGGARAAEAGSALSFTSPDDFAIKPAAAALGRGTNGPSSCSSDGASVDFTSPPL